uniref:Uncharacterized protein n=1 Tax=Fagus sylvatica TaxID=28930 RepID=A0A2N9I4J0_FAGSY
MLKLRLALTTAVHHHHCRSPPVVESLSLSLGFSLFSHFSSSWFLYAFGRVCGCDGCGGG